MLAELVTVFDAADGARDLVLAFGAGAAGDLVGQLAERRLGGAQQILALAGAFLGQQRVAADDEPLAGEIGGGDLGQVAFPGLRRGRREQRELEGAGVEQSADLRGSPRRDPAEPGGLQLVADAGVGDHPAVPTGQARDKPKRSLSLSLCADTTIRSPCLPSNTPTPPAP